MATTAKKTTTKKPTRKSAKTTAKPKAAVTKKATVSKAVKKPSTKASAVKKDVKTAASATAKRILTPLERIRNLHVVSAILYVLFAVLAAVFLKNTGSDITLNIQARDYFTSSTNVVLAPAQESLLHVQYRYVLAAILVICALGSLLLATTLRKRYEATISARVSGMRWVLMGVGAGLILEFISLIAGITDVMELKLIAALILATTLLGWVSERENLAAGKKWLAFYVSLFTGALAWFPAIGAAFGTVIYGGERYGWNVYALMAAALIGFTGFALNQSNYIKNKDKLEYSYVEERYIRIDQLTKFAIVLIVFSWLAK